MHTRFVLRAILLLLALTALLLAAVSFLPAPLLARLLVGWTAPPDPTPLPPTITAPRGAMPAGPAGLQEWRQNQGQDPELVGSGFLLQLTDGTVVGVTTAHSLGDLGQPGSPLEVIMFADAAGPGRRITFDSLHGPPGLPRTGLDLSGDYVLLRVSQPVDPGLALLPDPRGAPQPGERVALFSGLGDGNGGRRELAGTVQTAEAGAVWVLMDEAFEAGRMSGSPLLSRHTGQVVGMAIAVAPRASRILIGFHPIGHLVALAESARDFPKIADYTRQ